MFSAFMHGGHYDPGLPYLFQTKFHYDALGRTNGLSFSEVSNGGALTTQGDVCQYDADGHMVKPCEDWSPFLGYDGSNVASAYGWIPGPGWTFVHGPGTDDPLLGLHRWGADTRLLVWVTDGNGRQFAVSDTTGGDPALQGLDFDGASGYRGWQWAGATRRSYGFSASRTGPSGVPTLSVYRNRLYDQATGRWTQEDPIGIAGGINLYQFNGNNPATYSDAFGLSPCSDLRDEVDKAAADLEGYMQRYLDHFANGDADAGHQRQIDSRRDRYDNKMKEYRHKKCHEKEANDHDDWMNGSGGAGAAVRAHSMLLPAPQSDKSDHGRGNHQDMTDAAGAVTVGFTAYVIVRTLLRFLVPPTNLVPVVP